MKIEIKTRNVLPYAKTYVLDDLVVLIGNIP